MTGQVLGIDIGGTKVAIATAAAGNRLHETHRPTKAAEGVEAVVDRIIRTARELVEADPAPLAGVGVVCPGVIRDDGVALAPNNPGWETLRLRETFAAAFPGVPVAVMNDVKAGALAESVTGALVGTRSGIYLNLGTGLAAALVVDGTVVEGAHGAAGEIAYQLPGLRHPSAYADGHAPLEEIVSGQAISANASAVLGRPVDAIEAFALAPTHPAVAAVVDAAIEALATHVANLSVALDPDRVVLAGGLVGQAVVLVPRLAAVLRRAVPFPPEVLVARHPFDAPLAGALVIAARAALPLVR
ncbi:ROK family protein [Micromonospora sp. CPCC 205371]|nr:ROK family protein [Micromonospora sp. CPCC 205371]